MIEIAIHEIQNYDMVQVLERAVAGEKVALVHNGTTFDILPSKSSSNEIVHNKNVHLTDLFRELNVALLSDYKFDREEANSR